MSISNRKDRKKIIVFSPHLDDAILDVFDHIQRWKEAGHYVQVVTVFTSFSSRKISKDVKKYSGICGLRPIEYEKLRKEEDAKAMKYLDIPLEYLDFVDAGFRAHDGALIYNSFRDIFSGALSPFDKPLETSLSRRLAQWSQFDIAVVPQGIGSHVDHTILRRCVEKNFSKNGIYYYVDYPYALKIRNWRMKFIREILFCKKSLQPMSDQKRLAISSYTSQIPGLFPKKTTYPEAIISHADSPIF